MVSPRIELKTHQQQIARINIATAPIQTFPPELLSEIFRLCPPRTMFHVTIPHHRNTVPWVLGQVCSLWRHISRTDPRLWEPTSVLLGGHHSSSLLPLVHAQQLVPSTVPLRLHLLFDTESYDKFWTTTPPELFSRIHAVIIRRQGNLASFTEEGHRYNSWVSAAPLRLAHSLREVTIYPDGDLGRQSADTFIMMLSGIIPWAQLKTLFISSAWRTLRNILPILRQCSAVTNCKLALSDTWGMDFDKGFVPTDLIFLPQLQSLVIDARLLPSSLEHWVVWDHISTLQIQGADVGSNVIHSILRQCINLQNLQCGEPKDLPLHFNDGDLPLPFLRSLNLKVPPMPGKWLLKSLRAPNLEILDVNYERPDRLNFALIRDMIVSSGCSLLSLRLCRDKAIGYDAAPHELLALLGSVPTAKYIGLLTIALDNIALSEIASGRLLPHLQTLECTVYNERKFLDMIGMRAEHQSHHGYLAPFSVTGILQKKRKNADLPSMKKRKRLHANLMGDEIDTREYRYFVVKRT